jgi:hypothetical protein
MDLLAVGGDDIQADDALASRAVDAAVPAVAALQQIATDTDALAMPAREEHALRLQVGHQEAAALARTDDGQPLLGIDRHVVEAADVEQNGAVAEVAGREAVSTRNDAHVMAVGPGIADAGDDFVGVDGLHDQLGTSLGHSLMPNGSAARGFVAVVATEKVPTGR